MNSTSSRPRILVTQQIPQAGMDLLQQFADVDVNPDRDHIWSTAEMIAHLPGHDGLYSLLTNRIDETVLSAEPALRIVANMAVGYDNIDVAAATRRGVAVTNTPGVLTDAVADFTWALLLAVARRVVDADRYTRAGLFHGWGPMLLLGGDLTGKTLGIAGFGRIGQAVARRALGFGLHTIYFSTHHADPALERDLNAAYVDFETLLDEADFVSLHVRSTPQTHHLIGPAQLARMKPTAYLINTARGPIVDEQALVTALEGGQIAGAALDVYEHEPAVHPGLLALENVVLAPHIASASLATRSAMATSAAENLRAFFAGQQPPGLLNPEVWRKPPAP